MNKAPVIETRDLTIRFGGNVAVNKVSLQFEEFRLKSIIGPNGAGKTTLFNLISGQYKPTSGRVYFKGEDISGLDFNAVEIEANRCFNCSCVAVNSSDMAPALIAMDAKIKTTKRTIEAEKFFTVEGDKTTVLEYGEIVVEIEVPAPSPGTKCKFIKSAIRKSIDFPIVNCAAAIKSENGLVKSARICVNAVYNQTPMNSLLLYNTSVQ